MVEIDSITYQNIAASLLEAIAGKDFFNGSVEYDTDEFYSSLKATLIVYRRKGENGEGGRIEDIVPVWWEYIMHTARGEVDTCFSWKELRNYLGLK